MRGKISKYMTCFSKVGETFQGSKEKIKSGTSSFRPRNIFSPHCSMKAGPGWCNKVMLKALKSVCPGIISAMNNEELAVFMSK